MTIPKYTWSGISRTPIGHLVANPRKLPIIPPLPPQDPPGEPNAPIAICGECGIEIRPVMHLACTNSRCPLNPLASLAATAGRTGGGG